ncbi:Angiopoietin-related protein 1,Veficolin-1,Ficolin-1-A,Angiopoietin-1,Fibrinogen C domain-containing protein 1,Ryncolin-1,Tenascin-N,Angiopoietin-related protein 7,Angiopoietin-related protein 6,Ficolin-3,Fibrinogen C domain-containing protein 1-B,Fibroleukin,Fibrinogen-like protein 1,Ficolin-1,Ficolin-1-B,Angiopoietin-4,Tenascin-R,Ryncolin-2,Techylectin-5B,Fibrinogen C domain-containing protein 1-A,Microfibril-associated glycoprotein 4,Fibrinogen-like protein A,Ryncolin-3,Angiopoietin-2,Tenascin-X,Ficolin|uniref:Fibrinogen C-terminal domain-containing protein n=1 Tax=Mytilus edulis TaxID=6550 RepID=A0A8S3TH57_MYTED|nr:Angiopoietin-related protein 1,Veficolin-1,Ficolin-1-A,Angiopoietin-1,Fibrinogen C domain-containing protein 1,Ryncolin-1,Tenascin-N,Angiopoietin-related protein 7,Angiopoietin-related protein 6,Ficolin-3,Fibrinogen C domain-containing protein 1-B,Fibroleukin,Fibrinogen-like protein 1,Ficolin-1,Ficolin-1-B,Angiopoietin-4,Tenascin-R,Ryncolin-2,Techylectin-5B,Fibrinogen C domain-containing protein 1-A,Microfibril-associated glycoprotein 4,Fibrinogen-like protein A,Ryncolin-3,Angiopoietin-2,Tenasci
MQASFKMYQTSKPNPCILLFTFVLVVRVTITNADRNRVTSTSDSGFDYLHLIEQNILRCLLLWKTTERVLSILATGKYRNVLHSDHNVRDCSDLERKHYRSGVYTIYPAGGAGFKVFCDMETGQGGWTVFQRRQDGKVDFYRGWEEYVNGFGNLNTEFWLGNDKIYRLTSRGQYELRVNLEDFDGNKAYAKYSTFYIGDKSTNYKLTVKGYSGTAGDSLKTHNKQAFSTKDKDNDSHSRADCAEVNKGGWWYKDCHDANLNGLYLGNKKDNKGLRWSHWKGSQSMKTTSMMIRRV